jgi:hypothetical protein
MTPLTRQDRYSGSNWPLTKQASTNPNGLIREDERMVNRQVLSQLRCTHCLVQYTSQRPQPPPSWGLILRPSVPKSISSRRLWLRQEVMIENPKANPSEECAQAFRRPYREALSRFAKNFATRSAKPNQLLQYWSVFFARAFSSTVLHGQCRANDGRNHRI